MYMSNCSSFQVMAKPIGPICNIGCKYCFYLEKEKLFPNNENFKMADNILESYIKQYIESQNTQTITFTWQGGEPTLLGVNYFRKIVELQQTFSGGKTIFNCIQTNGTLLTDEFCIFLKENSFLVGLSIDGPPKLHNAYRVNKKGQPTYDNVINGLKLLKKHHVEFNTITVVNRVNSKRPIEVYEFLKKIGSTFIQFIPLVERLPNEEAKILGFDLAVPPKVDEDTRLPVTDWSVEPKQYGEFLSTIFDEWVKKDVGKVFVQLFDVTLGNWSGLQPNSLCVFSENCGNAVALEHDGTVYSCDHYVYPRYRLGNISTDSLGDMISSEKQTSFGCDKSKTLPLYCRNCEVKFACHGECPKHRFIRTPDGEGGLNYLCSGYKKFFNHIRPQMNIMTELLRQCKLPSEIMRRK